MNFLELTKNRYSCRAYKTLDVEKEKLEYIMECVRFAPSAVNKQPHGNIDIAIAVEHLCLAATEQGLATCWVCNFDANLCKEQFSLPENEEPAVIIPLGYAADEMKSKSRKFIETIVK